MTTICSSFFHYSFVDSLKDLKFSKMLASHKLIVCLQEKECLELKKERDKKDEQLKFVAFRHEEENGRANHSKSINT